MQSIAFYEGPDWEHTSPYFELESASTEFPYAGSGSFFCGSTDVVQFILR